ncbi:MAG: hypothetical protein JXB49_10215 [Bacteroidales bacterium]|nr:hypothetical protein [Bacteroidales bacterium]
MKILLDAILAILNKIKFKLWQKIVHVLKKTKYYNFLYYSYWHYLFFGPKTIHILYFSAVPNPGAGIGHQIANWIAGYWFAKQFGLRFAHTPFSNEQWEEFLGFGENEISVDELVKSHGYKKVLLPLFDENNVYEVDHIKHIISSYMGKKVVFICEQDQFYHDQYGVMDDLKKKFYSAKARKKDKIVYKDEYYNIAVHIRRGDIIVSQKNKNPNLLLRWQGNDYFYKVLKQIIGNLNVKKPIAVYLFSQGNIKDFSEFEEFDNINYCFAMSAMDSFLHMVYADLLITSKSSFSYKPALLNNGIKVCPSDFWHGYPETSDWIVAESDSIINVQGISC